MELLHMIDTKDYDPTWPVVPRDAVRAVIIRDGKIALLKTAQGFLALPGGGIEDGESWEDAVVREVREETGLLANSSTIAPLGVVKERTASLTPEHIFEQNNFLYYLEVANEAVAQSLTDEETADGYELVWIEPSEAIEINREICCGEHFILTYIWILEYLQENLSSYKNQK